MLWPKNLNKEIKTKINLAELTSFKIGGAAEYFFEPENLKILQQVLIFARHNKMPVFILGGGSNILVSDRGLKGIVIRLSGPHFTRCSSDGSCIEAGSGLKLNKLISFAKQKNLSGLEFLAGIPGTLGGSLLGNAGAWGRSIGELVKEVGVLDYTGKYRRLTTKELKFAYRKSNLGKFIIISVKLKLQPAPRRQICLKINKYLLQRKQSQGHHLPNAGCIFKNPGARPAGRLIDLCGLKGAASGRAVISTEHANFILNTGCAKCKDVLSLMKLVQKRVKEKFRINLEPEVKIWK